MRMFLLLCFLSLVYCTQSTVLRVAAFNIQVFGKTKAGKADVMEHIRKIVSAYDIILIQEIRDKSGDCMEKLLGLLNKNCSEPFAYIASERLGRTSSKEQYAYYYKTKKVSIVKKHLFNDSAADEFEREPFGVSIQVNQSTLDLALVGVHIKPSEAKPEIDAMFTAYEEFKSAFGIQNMLIMGDMNADCSYLSELKQQQTELFSDVSTFWSLITRSNDTTTYDSDCAYDRIIATGEELKGSVLRYGIEHFETEFGLSDSEMKSVSDHYPVWVEINMDA